MHNSTSSLLARAARAVGVPCDTAMVSDGVLRCLISASKGGGFLLVPFPFHHKLVPGNDVAEARRRTKLLVPSFQRYTKLRSGMLCVHHHVL